MINLFWKSNRIINGCKSPKDAETRNISRVVDNARFIANQMGFALFGKEGKGKIDVHVFPNSLPLLESLASFYGEEEKLMEDWEYS